MRLRFAPRLCIRLTCLVCIARANWYSAKLKNEKQQLSDSVEALSKRVQRLEESSGTSTKQDLSGAKACSGPGLCLVTSPSTATTPEYLPFTDMAGAGLTLHSSSTMNLTDTPGDAWRDVHRLFELSRCGQSTLS